MAEPTGLKKLFEQRVFWIALSILLVGLDVRSWLGGETAYGVIYIVFLAFTVARASGWRLKPM